MTEQLLDVIVGVAVLSVGWWIVVLVLALRQRRKARTP